MSEPSTAPSTDPPVPAELGDAPGPPPGGVPGFPSSRDSVAAPGAAVTSPSGRPEAPGTNSAAPGALSTGRGVPAPTTGSAKLSPTRASSAYLGVGVGLVILILIIIFVAQNLHESSVHFLAFHFRLAEGLVVLASAVAGGLIVLLVSLARVLQLRRLARSAGKVDRPA